MAYSPYPYANGEEENPCIAVSNDLLYWETPDMLSNPIADNEETGCNELKDPHLVYREDMDRLEVWYLGRLSKKLGGDGKSLLLMRKHSSDGIKWSDYEIMTEIKYLSPSIIWDGSEYRMWAIGYDLYDTTGTISYQTSKDGYNWSESVLCSVGGQNADIDIWHGSVTVHDGVYYMSYIDNTDKQEVYCCISSDGVEFNYPEAVIQNNGYWRNLYRPYLWFNGIYYNCIYGIVNDANQWYISMSRGTELTSLQGITDSDSDYMYSLNDTPYETHGIKWNIKKIYDGIRQCMRFELFILAFVEIIIMIASKKCTGTRYLVGCAVFNFIFSVFWIVVRMRLYDLFYVVTATVSILILNVSMMAILKCVQYYRYNTYTNI